VSVIVASFRLIRKWLKAGVMEDGNLVPTEAGTPQGAVISPLLANIYLHYAFDLWADQWRKHHAKGQVIVVRYADDIVMGFQHEREAIHGGHAPAAGEVRAIVASGEDPADRVRSLRGQRSREPRDGQAGDVQLPWVHSHLQPVTPGRLPA
jgi:hypothetical protein